MTTALIADDEPHLARALSKELQNLWPELQIVHVARHGLDAAQHIASLQPDVAFLDIQMPGLTGLEVAQGIEGSTRVVFVTAFDEYAVQAFEQAALDYVLKPVQTERLRRTVQRVQTALQPTSDIRHPASSESALDSGKLLAALQKLMPKPDSDATGTPLRWIRASSGDVVHQVAVADVLFFHADDKYTCVQTADAEYLIRTPISELAASLDTGQFVQMHRSTIVNLAHLAGTRRDESSRLFLRIKAHAKELPVSRAYVHLFKAM